MDDHAGLALHLAHCVDSLGRLRRGAVRRPLVLGAGRVQAVAGHSASPPLAILYGLLRLPPQRSGASPRIPGAYSESIRVHRASADGELSHRVSRAASQTGRSP